MRRKLSLQYSRKPSGL